MELLDDTIAIWQPRAKRPLSREDAREILENLTGFFSVLREWQLAEQAAESSKQKRSRKCAESPAPSP